MLWELKWKIELVLKIIGRAFVEPNNRTAREAGWVGEESFQKYIGRDWVALSPVASQCASLGLMAVLKTLDPFSKLVIYFYLLSLLQPLFLQLLFTHLCIKNCLHREA